MIHQMKLAPEPFGKIRSGNKTIELRLNDEKRQRLAVGDRIVFSLADQPGQKLLVVVTGLHRFDSFDALYQAISLWKCGYTPQEAKNASPRDMDAYYSREEQARWGVVGIEMKLLSDGTTARYTRTSRYLSLLLRHKPERAGLTLDEHGWADVEELIRAVSRTHTLNMGILEEIVAMDNKQRYAFSADGKRIRANQGHSVAVDVELEEQVPPEQLWHGTAEKSVTGIEQNGLLPRSRLYVHLSGDYETAVNVGSRHGKPVVFRVQSGQMYRDGYRFYRSANGVWLTKCVPAEYLQR